MTISNPVLTGFYADPSMIRVGDRYYLATSTFEWWPGVTLHESTDLAHWTPLPSPLNRTTQLDMRGNPAGGGIWAPDLSYADGKFWLVYTDVKGMSGNFTDLVNYLVTADDIRGPWSEPIRLNGVGFDASLFHDADGRKYLVQQTTDFREWRHSFNGITITEYSVKERRLLPETMRTLWEGTDVKVVEGPHLYRIGDWYYLFCAEGGTSWEHQESVARARTLDGPFETMPGNPFISNFTTPDFGLQKQGHGSLVETPEGEWYYASLCGRPWHHPTEPVHGTRGWCTLGRETAIQKVTWDSDGWPRIVGGPAGMMTVPGPGESAGNDSSASMVPASVTVAEPRHFHDSFTDDSLEIGWNTQRVPFAPTMGETGQGRLKLVGQGSLTDRFDLSLVARRWRDFAFDARVSVEFRPTFYQQMAGLTNYYSDLFWSWIYVTWDAERGCRVIDVAQNDFHQYTTFLRDKAIPVPDDVERVTFRTRVRTQTYTYDYSFDDGATWQPTGIGLDAKILSDDYVMSKYWGFFTGAFVGMACVDMTRYGQAATFRDFDYRAV
ncbi:glycoside hydrolase family 43 protein [Bifidobacterium choloepi]|uniref:Glycoside hydrolase family 43 protein n=1 Tax=Bifidobacterium choloepi TaxID=2614131 RepID=A0A6I5N6U7_9BIFI|nr:glycoside hydrolase family 43 protein [Bifidobacterium choloepi]NEG69531.1 glycoside hydrolase family 43 protein [Bifidobacterium choloepi]